MFISRVCCLCSGHCDKVITRLGESYCVCVCVCVCLVVCDLQTSTVRRPRPASGCCATEEE
jgi:hypothetical protein